MRRPALNMLVSSYTGRWLRRLGTAERTGVLGAQRVPDPGDRTLTTASPLALPACQSSAGDRGRSTMAGQTSTVPPYPVLKVSTGQPAAPRVWVR